MAYYITSDSTTELTITLTQVKTAGQEFQMVYVYAVVQLTHYVHSIMYKETYKSKERQDHIYKVLTASW